MTWREKPLPPIPWIRSRIWLSAVLVFAIFPASAEEVAEPNAATEVEESLGEPAGSSAEDPAATNDLADRGGSSEVAPVTILEEISVTARRYEEYLQMVPASVNVMTSKFLENQGIVNVREVIDFAPGGATTAFNKMQDRYSLRGISSQTEGSSGDSSVATVIDNVVISREFMKSQAFFDMEGVEILRGPQGTAFGRNASSGLIHLKSARPSWEFGSGLALESGTYETYGVEAFVTGALNSKAAGRLAMRFNNIGGYTEDTSTSNLLGGTENLAVRGALLLDPSSSVKVFFKAEYSRDDDSDPSPRKGRDCSIDYQGNFPEPSIVGAPQPPWTQFPNWADSCDPWETRVSKRTYLGDFFLEREILNLTSEVEWKVPGDLTLTSVTAYLEGNSDYLIDTHGGPNNSLFQSTQNDAWQLSQELRVDNHSSLSRLRFLAGAYFLSDSQTRDDQNIFYVDDAVSDPQHPSGFRPETRDIKQQNNETAAFGLFAELTYDLTDRLNATLAGRWSDDHKDYSVAHYGWGWGGPIAGLTDGVNRCVFDPAGPPDFGQRFCGSPEDPVGFQIPVPTDASWSNLSFKGSMSYIINPNSMVYGLVAEGYKTGGFQNEPFNPADALVPFNEETAINYEVGYRSTFGGRFRINASVFSTQYDDLQLFLFVNSETGDYSQVTANAAGADVRGVELDYIWQITDKLRLSGSYARMNSELSDALIDTDGDFIPEDYSGMRPDMSPEWTGSAVAEYSLPLKNGSSFRLRGDWRGMSDVYDGIGEDPHRRHDSYGVFGARVTWTPPGARWSVSLWGRNLFDEAYTINVGPYNPNLNQLNFAYGPPRGFGVTLRHFLF